MKPLIRLFFRTLRAVLGPFLLLGNWLTRPKGIVRPPAEQQAVDARTRKLALYHFPTCPFCLKTRRVIRQLSLDIELRNAPFFGWIDNLAGPDVLYKLSFSLPFLGPNVSLLPLLMGGAMIWQSKIGGTMAPTGQSGPMAQQRAVRSQRRESAVRGKQGGSGQLRLTLRPATAHQPPAQVLLSAS